MTETLSAKDGANAGGPASDRDHMRDHQPGGIADLRRTGINHEVFPLILDVRDVLRTNGVPIRPEATRCAAAAFCGHSPLARTTPPAEPNQPG